MRACVARPLAMWLGSFLLVAMLLVLYMGVSVGPIILAGGVTLIVTLVRAVVRCRQTPL